jgi:hypothetical protein
MKSWSLNVDKTTTYVSIFVVWRHHTHYILFCYTSSQTWHFVLGGIWLRLTSSAIHRNMVRFCCWFSCVNGSRFLWVRICPQFLWFALSEILLTGSQWISCKFLRSKWLDLLDKNFILQVVIIIITLVFVLSSIVTWSIWRPRCQSICCRVGREGALRCCTIGAHEHQPDFTNSRFSKTLFGYSRFIRFQNKWIVEI